MGAPWLWEISCPIPSNPNCPERCSPARSAQGLPHKAFLSGLWWKLLSIQPMQLLAALPMLGYLRQAAQPSPGHFVINGFSAGSYTGAVIALAIRCLWPHCQITARLGAIAMPKGVLAALVATADENRHHYYLVHAGADSLCDWKPSDQELQMLQQNLHVTYVEESARWMGSCKHKYCHWLHCQLPQGLVRLTDLNLSHPTIPNRDRMAAPMRLASWIRFETLLASADWSPISTSLTRSFYTCSNCACLDKQLPRWTKRRPFCCAIFE